MDVKAPVSTNLHAVPPQVAVDPDGIFDPNRAWQARTASRAEFAWAKDGLEIRVGGKVVRKITDDAFLGREPLPPIDL